MDQLDFEPEDDDVWVRSRTRSRSPIRRARSGGSRGPSGSREAQEALRVRGPWLSEGESRESQHDCEDGGCEDDFFCSRGLSPGERNFDYDSRCDCYEAEAIEEFWCRWKPDCVCPPNGGLDKKCLNHKTCVYCLGCMCCYLFEEKCSYCKIDNAETKIEKARRQHHEWMCSCGCRHFDSVESQCFHDSGGCEEDDGECKCFN